MAKKLISIVTPCYQEEGNIGLLIDTLRDIMSKYADKYDYEQIIIDNASTDNTVAICKAQAAQHKNIKLIVNARNFGHVRSSYYGFIQAMGDAVIVLASDFQDPPELIPQFIEKWESGYRMVLGIKNQSEEGWFFNKVRKFYYSFSKKLSDVQLIKNFTGFGLYDKLAMDTFRKFDDPYPYFRGMVSEIGFEKAFINFNQPNRKRGFSKNNFYTLYDVAMLGITGNSKIPLRLATFLGFAMSAISLIITLVYLVLKLCFWYSFSAGMAPIVIGIFFFASVQLFFIGILGEYIGAIHTQLQRRPMVVELERVNF